MPGTFGSLVGLLWFALLLCTNSFLWFLIGTLAGIPISVWLCGRAETILDQKDPSSVVMDEIVAIPFCFLAALTQFFLTEHALVGINFFVHHWQVILMTFFLFRVFDIWKPWPIRGSQSLRGGWGVTIDDLLAGTYVNLVLIWWMTLRGGG